jgi:predicted thioesterase
MITIPIYEKGESVTVQRTVTEDETAMHYGSGKLETLFAIPALLEMMLEAGSELVDKKLPEGYLSVGKRAMVDHSEPTVMGEKVTVKVIVDHVDGNKVYLKMEAYDEVGLIGKGENTRVIVNRQGMLNRAQERVQILENKDF